MAQIRDIRLDMGVRPDQQAVAEVRFSIEFSETELRRNMQYGMYVGLFVNDERAQHAELEQNGAYQVFRMPTMPPFGADGPEQFGHPHGGQSQWRPYGASGLVCWIARENLHPGQLQTHHIARKSTFDLNRRPMHQNGFRAYVWVVPEITQGQAFSKPVRMGQADPSYVASGSPYGY